MYILPSYPTIDSARTNASTSSCRASHVYVATPTPPVRFVIHYVAADHTHL